MTVPGRINMAGLTLLLFLATGVTCIFISYHAPLGDFGNYYYGSVLLKEGSFSEKIYHDLHFFNKEITTKGQTNFFNNYIPVPPFSAIFYLPFSVLSAPQAKLLFNCLALLLFCLALARALAHCRLHSPMLLLLPFVFYFPLMRNMQEGQAYLLITALLLEALRASDNKKTLLPSFYIALCISLKLFPAFVLVYFLFRQNYRIVLWTCIFVTVLFLITVIFVQPSILFHYFTQIVPRLFNNEIIGPYHYNNQSFYSALLTTFSFDGLNNRSPFVNAPFIVPLIESVIVSTLITFLGGLKRERNLLFFGSTLFVLILSGRYNTSYALMLLLPFFLGFSNCRAKTIQLVIFSLIAVAFYTPLFNLMQWPSLLRYLRLTFLFSAFVLIYRTYKGRFNLRLFAAVLLPLALVRCMGFSIKPVNYFFIQNTGGILYDFNIKGDSLILLSTEGANTISESFYLKGTVLKNNNSLCLQNNTAFCKAQTVYGLNHNTMKSFIFNDTCLVFMSDLNQAVSFYKLQYLRLHAQ